MLPRDSFAWLAHAANHFAEIAQEIFELTYLQPFDGRNKENLYSLPVERVSHGAQHASRVAAYIRVLVNLCRYYGITEAIHLSEDQITLLQIAGLFHDAARKSDKTIDYWESESAALFTKYITSKGIPTETAAPYADAICSRSMDNFYSMILKSADAIDIIRVKADFQLNLLPIYHVLQNNKTLCDEIINIVKEARALIARQHDMKFACQISYQNRMLYPAIPATRNPNKPTLKQDYEQAAFCYTTCTSDFSYFDKLDSYYNDNQLIIPQIVSSIKEIQKKSSASPNNAPAANTNKSKPKDNPAKIMPSPMLLSIIRNARILDDEKTYTIVCRSNYISHTSLCTEFEKHNIKGKLVKSGTNYIGIKLDADNTSRLENLYHDYLDQRPVEALLGEDYLIKSLRDDEFDFYRDFVDSITRSPIQQRHFKLRQGHKKTYTVDGTGFHSRSERKPQYTREQKQFYSQPQSTSMVTTQVSPPVFGHDKKRRDKLVGIMMHKKNALLSRRLFIYDGGTVGRPYDTHLIDKAKHYYHLSVKSANPILFADPDQFKQAIAKKENRGKYNEVLARLRWNTDGSCMMMVASDTIEARLLAQDRKRVLQERLRAQAAEFNQLFDETYDIPIVFYLPGSPKHLQYYDDIQQAIDRYSASEVLNNQEHFDEKIKNKDYEYLLCLENPQEIIFNRKSRYSPPLIIKIIVDGYIQIAISLLEKCDPKKIARNAFDSYDREIVQLAVSRSRTKLIEWLILFGVSVDIYINNEGQTLLAWAAQNAHEDLYFLLIQQGADTQSTDKQGTTLLMHAAKGGNLLILKHAIKTTKNIDQKNISNETALTFAAKHGHHAISSYLLENSACANVRPPDCKTPLHYAAENGHADIVDLLLSHNADPSRISTGFHETALLLAAKNNHLSITASLIKRCNNVNVANKCGTTPLHYAARNGNRDMMFLFLDHGAEINAMSTYHDTALLIALENGHSALARELIQCGANIHAATDNNDTTLILAADKCKDLFLVKELLVKGVDPNIQNKNGRSIFIWAVSHEHEDVIRMLLDLKANPNLATTTGYTVLMLACYKKNPDIVERLINANANVNQLDENNESALFYAIRQGSLSILKLLLARGAKPNIINRFNASPLGLAIGKNNHDLINTLLDYGADPSLAAGDNNEKAPFIAALNEYKIDIIKLLLRSNKCQLTPLKIAIKDWQKNNPPSDNIACAYLNHLIQLKLYIENKQAQSREYQLPSLLAGVSLFSSSFQFSHADKLQAAIEIFSALLDNKKCEFIHSDKKAAEQGELGEIYTAITSTCHSIISLSKNT